MGFPGGLNKVKKNKLLGWWWLSKDDGESDHNDMHEVECNITGTIFVDEKIFYFPFSWLTKHL